MFIFITFISSKSPCRIDSIRYSVCARDTPFWQEQTDEDSGGWMKSWHCYSLVKWCQMRMDSLHQIKETQKKHRKKGKTIRISKHFKTFCETSGNRQCLEQLRCFSPDLAPIAVWSGRWDLQMGRDCPDSWKVLEGPGRSWKDWGCHCRQSTKALGGFDCISEIPKSKWDLDAFGPKTQGHQIVQIFASSLVYAEEILILEKLSGPITVQSSLHRDDCAHLFSDCFETFWKLTPKHVHMTCSCDSCVAQMWWARNDSWRLVRPWFLWFA